jgi:hypothetical protein
VAEPGAAVEPWDAPCRCPWLHTDNPCIQHTHYRTNIKSKEWDCFLHTHVTTTGGIQ